MAEWAVLPHEVLLAIAQRLGPDHWIEMSQVCKSWRCVSNDDCLWKQACHATWHDLALFPEQQPELGWKLAWGQQMQLRNGWLHKRLDVVDIESASPVPRRGDAVKQLLLLQGPWLVVEYTGHVCVFHLPSKRCVIATTISTAMASLCCAAVSDTGTMLALGTKSGRVLCIMRSSRLLSSRTMTLSTSTDGQVCSLRFLGDGLLSCVCQGDVEASTSVYSVWSVDLAERRLQLERSIDLLRSPARVALDPDSGQLIRSSNHPDILATLATPRHIVTVSSSFTVTVYRRISDRSDVLGPRADADASGVAEPSTGGGSDSQAAYSAEAGPVVFACNTFPVPAVDLRVSGDVEWIAVFLLDLTVCVAHTGGAVPLQRFSVGMSFDASTCVLFDHFLCVVAPDFPSTASPLSSAVDASSIRREIMSAVVYDLRSGRKLGAYAPFNCRYIVPPGAVMPSSVETCFSGVESIAASRHYLAAVSMSAGLMVWSIEPGSYRIPNDLLEYWEAGMQEGAPAWHARVRRHQLKLLAAGAAVALTALAIRWLNDTPAVTSSFTFATPSSPGAAGPGAAPSGLARWLPSGGVASPPSLEDPFYPWGALT